MTPAQNKSPAEEWKAIPGFEGYYEASTLGNIRSVNRIINCPWGEVYPAAGKPKAKCKDRDGYYHVCLSKEGKRCYPTVHRLIAKTFISNPDNKPCVDHIDGDKLNNIAENLRWCTVAENNRNPITRKRHRETVYSEERNNKISKSLKGHVLSLDTRKKISESHKLFHKKLKENGRTTNNGFSKANQEAGNDTCFQQSSEWWVHSEPTH